jgi:precorrin-2 dehydrogenase/sirohydrochlorin ferrochelatase
VTTVPLFLRLAGARVVCVGAGAVAGAKVLPLVDAGADVVVVAPAATQAVADAAAAGLLTWHARGWAEADLDGAYLVVAGTADAGMNAAVAAAAAARSTLCVRVDREGDGTADFAAVVRRGDLTLAVSTGGRAPALARRLRGDLQERYGPEWADAVALYGELREDARIRQALAALSSEERRRRWRSLPLTDILRMLRTGRYSEAKRAASSCLSSSSD